MKAHAIDCCHGAGDARDADEAPRGWTDRAVGAGVFAVLAALVPKCPLCIVAWLGVLGLAGVATKVDPRLLWVAAVLAILAAALAAAALTHRLRRALHGLTHTTTRRGDGT